MKVTLVGINSKFIHSNLAVRYLEAYTRDLNYDCSILEFSINDLKERIVTKIMETKPNIIGFSCYIWNVEFIKKISNTIKTIDESIKIFVGGPEVSFEPRNFLKENNIDFLIEGEGEQTYRAFIESVLENKINDYAKNIKGLYSKENNQIFYGGKRQVMDINNIVFPYTEDENLENKIVYYEASRGCPFGCKYCLSSVDRKVRFLDVERVKKELGYFIDKDVKLVKFVDRTFNCNPKFAEEIWKFICDQNESIKTTFHFEISADLFKKEQIEILRKCPKGRIQFEVGVQTTNNNILRNINRHVDFKDIKQKVVEVEKLTNIKQHLDLIAGLPGEDLNSFKKSFDEVYSIKPEEVQLGFLKLLKGSPMINEADKWGMKYLSYPPYEILKTNDISYEEIIELKRVEKVVDKYYNSNKFMNILKYFENQYDSVYEFYKDLSDFCEKSGYFDRSLSSSEYYKVFLEFNDKFLKNNNDILNEIIKYDYLIHNKRKWIPDFIKRDFDKKFNKFIKENVKKVKKINDKDCHIEKFTIDILKFVHKDQIESKDTYIFFNDLNSNSTYDITNFTKSLVKNQNY